MHLPLWRPAGPLHYEHWQRCAHWPSFNTGIRDGESFLGMTRGPCPCQRPSRRSLGSRRFASPAVHRDLTTCRSEQARAPESIEAKNSGISLGGKDRTPQAKASYLRFVSIAPSDPVPHAYSKCCGMVTPADVRREAVNNTGSAEGRAMARDRARGAGSTPALSILGGPS